MSEPRKVILLLATSRAHARGLLYGIAKYSRLHGPWIFDMAPPFYREPGTVSRLKKWGADGVIAPDARENKEIIAMGLPTIVYRMAKDRIPHLPAIIADDETVGIMSAEHLLDRGFRRFAYCGVEPRPWSQARSESFSARILDAGFQTDLFSRKDKLKSRDSFNRQQNLLSDWLKSLPKPVGLMAGNDACGRYVMQACRRAGLNVPDEVAVIGVDNDSLICDLTEPPLSSIAMNTEKAGYEVAQLLDGLMAGEKMTGQNIVVQPTHIATRQSTEILAIDDREVAEAIRFIRQNARQAIAVGDVVNHAAMSRRSLEIRFHRAVGRSIHNEIKRFRAQQIVRMLAETDLSISEIALELGHHSSKHLARYFRAQLAMSPLEYRRRFISSSPGSPAKTSGFVPSGI
ncbi:MAG: substrate-binding domain-containing protein [Planctomycetes bacterium]|nr:substrate-binding domain-containing protein [Planctomycetota bacterium]